MKLYARNLTALLVVGYTAATAAVASATSDQDVDNRVVRNTTPSLRSPSLATPLPPRPVPIEGLVAMSGLSGPLSGADFDVIHYRR
jgi:hypothetical protein